MAEWVCLNCRSINNPGATSCYSCASPRHLVEATPEQLSAPVSHTSMATGAPAVHSTPGLTPTLDRLGGTPAVSAPGTPMAQAAGYPDSLAVPAEQRPVNLVGGLLAGLGAAVVATLVWYGVVVLTEYQVGFVAAAIGWLVGFAVVFGAGGRASLPLVVASAVLTVLALGVSTYLIAYHVITEFLGLAFELIQPPDVIFEIILEVVMADPVTLVFWAIALFGAVSVPFRSMSSEQG